MITASTRLAEERRQLYRDRWRSPAGPAIQESIGHIVDRDMEHLAASDRMVILTRRVMLDAAKEFAVSGKLPEVVTNPELARDARGGDIVVPTGPIGWKAMRRRWPRSKATAPGSPLPNERQSDPEIRRAVAGSSFETRRSRRRCHVDGRASTPRRSAAADAARRRDPHGCRRVRAVELVSANGSPLRHLPPGRTSI